MLYVAWLAFLADVLRKQPFDDRPEILATGGGDLLGAGRELSVYLHMFG